MLKIIFFIILSIAGTIYLHKQAKEDVVTKTVPVLPNLIAIGVSVLCYGLGCLFTWQVPDFKGIAIAIIALTILTITRVFGKGDAKALFAIAMIGNFATPGAAWSSELNPVLVVLTYIIATIVFLPANIRKGRKEGISWSDILFGKNRSAFFPYIKIGFVLSSIISLLLQITYLI